MKNINVHLNADNQKQDAFVKHYARPQHSHEKLF